MRAVLSALRLPTVLLTTAQPLRTSRLSSSAAGVRAPPADAACVEADGKQAASVIFLHGLGDTGDGWATFMPEIDALLPEGYKGSVRYILPHAPVRPISLNGGMSMPGWFDMFGLGPDDPEDAKGIGEAVARVEALVQDEIDAGVPPQRIIVGGFSQGGSIALQAALRSEVPLAGCVALSTWLSLRDEYPAALGPHAKAMPLLQCHGDADQVVATRWGDESHKLVCGWKEKGTAKWVVAPGVAHGVDMGVLREVAGFVGEALKRPIG